MGSRAGIPWGQPAHSSKAVSANSDVGSAVHGQASRNLYAATCLASGPLLWENSFSLLSANHLSVEQWENI